MEHQRKIQKWIDYILADELESVASEVKKLSEWDLDPKLNKFIFKALLCLSHSAERLQPADIHNGKRLFEIADELCYSLTEISDFMKYFSGLYYISRKLIIMQMYREAMNITVWSFPGNLVYGLTPQQLDMYPKIASLWRDAAVKLTGTKPPCNINKANHKLLLDLINNELRVLEAIVKERTMFVLCRTLRYLTNLDILLAQYEYNSNQNHRSIIKSFLAKINITLTREEKYEIYQDALRFINSATIAAINSSQVENAPTVLADSCSIVETILNTDPELCRCLSLYKNMGMILLKSINNSQKLSHWELSKLRKETLNIIEMYEYSKGATLNMRMIGHILQPVLVHWERYIGANNHEFLKAAILQEILGLIQLMFTVLNLIWSNGCEICRDNDCTIQVNTHTVTVISMKCLATLSKIPANDLLRTIFPFVQELLEETVEAIFEMKECNCAQWSPLWNNCAIHIYNLSVSCHKELYEESVYLFSLLCSAIVKFEGLQSSNNLLSMKNPLSYVLHRLSSVHYNHGSYREALTLCALNGLLSYQNADSKAFRMWASIKHTCATSSDILSMTMLACLREDIEAIATIGINVRLDDYDLNELCIHELRGLLEGRCNLSLSMQAALDELENLNSGGLVYAQGVQMLGYHMLQYEYDQNFTKYLKRAIVKLKEDKIVSNLHLTTAANLDFYTFVVNLHDIIDHTTAEMQTSKFALRAAKPATPEGEPNHSDAVVPAYSKINIGKDSQLFVDLHRALTNWNLCIENNVNNPIEEWHLLMMLRTLVIVGEFCRLHHFSMLESKTWNLAYKLASNLKDASTCLHVVGRSISLRTINSDWIRTGNELMTELQTSSDHESNDAIAFFCLGLSKFYFEIGKHDEGAKSLDRTVTLPNVHPVKNVQLFSLSMKTALQNYPFCSNDTRSKNHMIYLVKCLYSLLVLMEYSPQPRVGVKKKQLYTSEILLTCTAHLSLSMNSLLSFKEISSHLTNRLKLAQSSGLTLRVAECLKNLCFIDLSRMQLNDCLVKLQGLEYILDIEHIKETQKTKNPETLNELGCRDSRVNDASPVLRKTVFKLPEFLEHQNCLCYKCSSIYYQNFVLASTHIRAQLYFFQGYLNEAMSHFGGALLLQRKMLQFERREKVAWKNVPESDRVKQHPWKCYYNAVEHVLFLINFSLFIRELESDDKQDGMSVALRAVDICERFHLQSHPVYVSAKEMVFEYQFCNRFQDTANFDKFTVPDPGSIDVNKYIHTSNNIESSKITTPAMKPCVRKPRTIRRNKTPPLLKLTKVSIDLDEYEDLSQSPKSSRQGSKASYDPAFPKSVRRKNLEKYLDSASDIGNPKTSTGPTVPGYTEESMNEKKSSWINSIATLLSANFSKQVAQIFAEQKLSEVEMIERLIELVKHQRKNDDLNTGSLKYGHRSGNKSYKKNSYLSIKDEKTFVRLINLTAFLFPSISKQLTEILNETGLHGSDKNERIIEIVKQQRAVEESKSESLDINYLCNAENSKRNSHLSSTKPDDVENLVSSLKETHIGIENVPKRTVTNAPRLHFIEGGSSMHGFASTNKCQYSYESEKHNEPLVINLYEDTSSVAKKSRVRLQFTDESETDPSHSNGEMDMRPEHIGHKERLRSSGRTARTRSQSSDIKQKRHFDHPDVVLLTDEVYESEACNLDERKTKFRSSARTRSKSQQDKSDCVTQFKTDETNDSKFVIESSILLGNDSLQSNTSDLIPTSDLEEQAMIEKRSKTNVKTSGIRSSARILRSRSQMNGITSSNVKISNTSGGLSTSGVGALTETTKRETCTHRSKALATSRLKKSR